MIRIHMITERLLNGSLTSDQSTNSEINKWIDETKPTIISVQPFIKSIGDRKVYILCITYEDNK